MKSQFTRKAYWRLADHLVQWLWFLLRVRPDRVGYDKGLLTWIKQRTHEKLQREIHICLLDVFPPGGKFGQFLSFWINERSSVCRATVNKGIEDADIVWIYSQDPLPPDIKRELSHTIKKARVETPVINHPDVYNSYHENTTFHILEKAGISVPRSVFTDQEMENTNVVYKMMGKHTAPKFMSPYKGTLSGFRPFEFVDSRDSSGFYKKYRAFYIAGSVFPDRVLFSDQWNVNMALATHAEYAFEMTSFEIDSLKRIAHLLHLQFFAIDYLRRGADGLPVFLDINLYPFLMEYTELTHQLGYYGRLMRFDTRERLGMKEPSENTCWHLFDKAMLRLVNSRPDD